MTKTITIRIPQQRYEAFQHFALRDDRPLSNFIETVAWRHLQECMDMEKAEEEEILGNKKLMTKIRRGIGHAKTMKGKFVN